MFCFVTWMLKLWAWGLWPTAQGIPRAAATQQPFVFFRQPAGSLKAAQMHQLTTSYKPQFLFTVLEHVPDRNISTGCLSCAFPVVSLYFMLLYFLKGIFPREFWHPQSWWKQVQSQTSSLRTHEGSGVEVFPILFKKLKQLGVCRKYFVPSQYCQESLCEPG